MNLSTTGDVVSFITGAAAVSAGKTADAELIAMGNTFEKVRNEWEAAGDNFNQDAITEEKWIMAGRQIDHIMEQIDMKTAQTLAGLRVKAAVAIHTSPQLWEQPMSDLDLHERGPRALLESVCNVTGLEVPTESV
jgi:hypothetical protein